jgi:hypothetical protein
MTTIPQTPAARKIVAYHATLFLDHVGVSGLAMRDATDHVFFRDDATQTWRELFDADAANLHLHGRVDLALAAQLRDGDLVLSASRTLPAARACRGDQGRNVPCA